MKMQEDKDWCLMNNKYELIPITFDKELNEYNFINLNKKIIQDVKKMLDLILSDLCDIDSNECDKFPIIKKVIKERSGLYE
jgi:hypothetical protein